MDANCNNCSDDALLSHLVRQWIVCTHLYALLTGKMRVAGASCRGWCFSSGSAAQVWTWRCRGWMDRSTLLPWALQQWLFAHGKGRGLIQHLGSAVIPCFLLKTGNEYKGVFLNYFFVFFFFLSGGCTQGNFDFFFGLGKVPTFTQNN